MEKYTDIKTLVFDYTKMWVQLHDVPIGLTWKAAVDIVSVVGRVDESALEDEKFEEGNFMRLRVAVDVTKLLCRGRKIALSGGIESWVSFRYERLPNLCYWCGKLTHMERECPIRLKGKGVLTEKDHQYGSWLRASTLNLARKTVVKVTGLEDEEPIADDQNHATESADEEGLLERENRRHSVTGSDAHEQGDSEGTRSGFLEGSGIRGEVVHASSTSDLFPNNPKLITQILVDSDLPTMEGIGMHRRIPESDFQVQLDAIDTELTKFDTGKGVGMDCGIGQEHHVDVHNGATLNSMTVDFNKDSDGYTSNKGQVLEVQGELKSQKDRNV